MLKKYFAGLFQTAQTGDAREESFYPDLKNLLENYADQNDHQDIHVTTLPKRTEAGNPDFRVWDGKQKITGYIEAKKPSVDNLRQIENSDQLKRYRDTFPNLILTNFFEFRLYRDGDLIDKVSTGRPFVLTELNEPPPVENQDEFLKLMDKFFSFSLPKTYSAESLAVELAKRTRFLRDEVVAQELREEAENGRGLITGFYDAFKKYLISGLSKEGFADLYSQTLTYGLFAARTRSEDSFNRKLAYDNIPHTIGILRDVFEFVSLGDVPKQMEWIIDDISEVLAVTDVKNILHKYYHEGKGKDPVVHFYETFLTKYDPQTREKRGVYYTPKSVVSYIVRSINHILKQNFSKSDGLASDSVTLLDPAAGTLTFIAQAAKLAVEEFTSKYGEGGKKEFIRNHILENFYAFELMMAPYAIGHLKISFLLEEHGYKFSEDERFKLYLTNTLEMEELPKTKLPGTAALSEESHLAGKVKQEQPILVILGNPPYSVRSGNKSDFIEKEMDFYKEDVRDERNIQPLSDDYIKFIRFAHWKIEQSGNGVIGMITNNSYLSGLIHRGMRKKLLESFDKIYILNLHGNSRIGERAPDGSKDENVFDIMQGVSIALFIKKGEENGLGKVLYEDVYGLQGSKYNYLLQNEIETTEWEELDVSPPYYFFVKKDFSLQVRYNEFPSLSKIFKKHSSGVKTHRDHFVVGFTKEKLEQRLRTFISDLPDEIVKQALDLNETSDFKIAEARNKIRSENWSELLKPYTYRPFDTRYICYSSSLIDRDRWNLMYNFFEQNIGFIFPRKTKKFCHGFVTANIADVAVGGKYSGSETNIAPLFLYSSPDKKDLFKRKSDQTVREPNIISEIFELFEQYYGETPKPEEILNYIYAILYSSAYREKYAEFLKIDFPRIPFTTNHDLFNEVGDFGGHLIDLHLLKSKELNSLIARFQGEGSNKIAKPKRVGRNYKPEEKRVYINKDGQYFEGIEPEVWEYQIGGYQVLDKWLKDRRERELSLDEIKHYCKVVTALQKTIEIQEKIDEIYPGVEEEIIQFDL